MITTAVTFICEPGLDPAGRDDTRLCYAFAEAVGKYGKISVPFIEGALHTGLPEAGFILLRPATSVQAAIAACTAAQQVGLASRIVPVGIDLRGIFENVLENLSVPAAVADWSLHELESTHRMRLGARGPHGLKTIAASLGVECKNPRRGPPGEPLDSDRYCFMHGPTHEGVPHLLVEYLAAFAGASRGSAEAEVASR